MKNLFSRLQISENNARFVWQEVLHYKDGAENVKENFEALASEEQDEHDKKYATDRKEKLTNAKTTEELYVAGNPPPADPAVLYPKEEKDSGGKENEDTRPTKSFAHRIGKMFGWVKEGDEGAGYNSTKEVEAEIAQEENEGGMMAGTTNIDENFIDQKLDADAETDGSDYVA